MAPQHDAAGGDVADRRLPPGAPSRLVPAQRAALLASHGTPGGSPFMSFANDCSIRATASFRSAASSAARCEVKRDVGPETATAAIVWPPARSGVATDDAPGSRSP